MKSELSKILDGAVENCIDQNRNPIGEAEKSLLVSASAVVPSSYSSAEIRQHARAMRSEAERIEGLASDVYDSPILWYKGAGLEQALNLASLISDAGRAAIAKGIAFHLYATAATMRAAAAEAERAAEVVGGLEAAGKAAEAVKREGRAA